MGKEKIGSFVKKNHKASRLLRSGIPNGQAACFFTRILPIPFDLVSMFFGASGMPFAKYMLLSLLGLTPNMIPWVMAGGAIDTPLSKEFLIPFGICISIAIVVFFVFQNMCKVKEAKNRRLGSGLMKRKTERKIAGILRAILVSAAVLLQILLLVLLVHVLRSYATYIYVIIQIIAVIHIYVMISRRQNTSYAIAWILAITLLPVIGLVLYHLWGQSNISGRQNKPVNESIARGNTYFNAVLQNEDIANDDPA